MTYLLPPKSTVLIASDHAGFEYKDILKKYLLEKDFIIEDVGTHSSVSCDYPDYAHQLASKMETEKYKFGILICSSGNGVCMVANKHKTLRAALCWNEEVVFLARSHNNANVLCLPARFIDIELCKKMLDIFLSTAFEGGRHQKRIEKF